MLTAFFIALITGAVGLFFALAKTGLGAWVLGRFSKSPIEEIEAIDEAEKEDLANRDPTGKATSDDLGKGKF